MDKISGIYCILNMINNKRYIGKSVNIYKRWEIEKAGLRNQYFHNKHLQRSWNKYGENVFEFSIIEQCDIDMLATREQFWIDFYDSYNSGYNQTIGGEGTPGIVFSDDRKQKLRDAHSGNIAKCCSGDKSHTTCGKLRNGTKLTWRYLTSEEIDELYNTKINKIG